MILVCIEVQRINNVKLGGNYNNYYVIIWEGCECPPYEL